MVWRYMVQIGDTLSGIASRFRIRGGWKRLAKVNGLQDGNFIYPGEVISIPNDPMPQKNRPADEYFDPPRAIVVGDRR